MNTKEYISSGVIEQYALGSLPREEASILECIMTHNEEVRLAVLEAQEAIELFSELDSTPPPINLKSQIASQLSFDDEKNKDEEEIVNTNQAKEATPIKNKTSVFKQNKIGFSIAASLLLFCFCSFILFNNFKNKELKALANSNTQLQSKLTNLEQQNDLFLTGKKVNLEGVEKHPESNAYVLLDKENRAYLYVNNLPSPPKEKQYQVWAIVNGKPVSLGLYNSDKEKLQEIRAINHAEAFAITLERKGGSPTPTLEEMYVFGKA